MRPDLMLMNGVAVPVHWIISPDLFSTLPHLRALIWINMALPGNGRPAHARLWITVGPNLKRSPAQPAAISRIARTGSLRTLHNAWRLSARGRVRPISQKYTHGAVTPTREATSATDKPRASRALRRYWFKIILRGKLLAPMSVISLAE
jgi:hypothetical protein